MKKHWNYSAVAAAAMLLAPVASRAATVVDVSLFDKGAATEMATGLNYATPGMDMAKATMGIKLSQETVKAGVVTFKVTNASKDTVHEMIVMYMKDPTKALPYDDKENRAGEDKSFDKGEVSELDPGKLGSVTVALKPGKYLLICNVPGHFGAGMWTEFTVTN